MGQVFPSRNSLRIESADAPAGQGATGVPARRTSRGVRATK